jgi:hypothetical protein
MKGPKKWQQEYNISYEVTGELQSKQHKQLTKQV